MILTKKLLLPASILLAINSYADSANIEQTITTATRTEQSISNVLAPSVVMDRADIEKFQAQDLMSLINRMPGVQVDRSGGKGSVTSVRIRGSQSRQTLLLIDGQRVGSATLGEANFSDIDIEQIERIEVVRGPLSSLYGSDAIGGVIQIFTRNGKGLNGHQATLKTGMGSNNGSETSIGIRGENDGFFYNLHSSHFNTDGIDHTTDNNLQNNDEDAYRNTSYSVTLGHRNDDGTEVRFSHQQSEGESEFDNAFSPSTRRYGAFRNKSTDLRFIVNPVKDVWSMTIAAGQSSDYNAEKDDLNPLHYNFFETERDTFTWQNDVTVAEGHQITIGAEYYEDSVKSTTNYAESTRDNEAWFAQYNMQEGIVSFTASLRNDDNEQFGTKTTGSIALGINVTDEIKAIVSYGTGFKAPTFNDLYFPFSGNPDLEAEESENYQLSFQGNYNWGNWEANFFKNRVDNLIAWAPIAPGSFIWKPSNINDARLQGMELVYSVRLGDVDINAAYTRLSARDTNTGLDLTYNSKDSFNLDVDYAITEKFSIGSSYTLRSEVWTNAGNTQQLKGYDVVDVRGTWKVRDDLKLQAKIDNIGDAVYQTRNGYNTEDRTYWISVTYTPSW